MIRYASGYILRAVTEAVANTVNSVGVMGRGIALHFKQAFPRQRATRRHVREEVSWLGQVRIPLRAHVLSSSSAHTMADARFIIASISPGAK